MAITIISSPKNPNTVANANRWVINSDKKTEPGFRYTVIIKDADTGSIIKQFTVAPRPNDGYGEFDVAKVLQDQLDISLEFDNLNLNLLQQWNKFKFNYTLTFGEKYITNWTFTDTEFVSGDLTKCVQSPVTTTHSFLPGDSVIITPTNPAIRPTFQGLYNVISLELITNFPIFSTPWVSTGLNSGTIKYADNRPTLFNALLTSSTFTVFKSTIDVVNWPTANITAYVLQTNIKQLFTNFKDNYYINTTQDLYWPFDYSGAVTLNYERNDGLIWTKSIVNRTSAKYVRYVNVAPKTNYSTGTGFLFDDDIQYYDFWVSIVVSGVTTQISKKYRINVNHNCKSSDIEILFEDKMGGFSSFAFDALYQYTINVTKEQYNQPILMNGSTYDPTNIQGITNITIDYDKEYIIRTRTLTKEQDLYFEELIVSGNTYIKLNGTYQRVDIVTRTADFKPTKQSGLRRRELRVKLANKNLSNF